MRRLIFKLAALLLLTAPAAASAQTDSIAPHCQQPVQTDSVTPTPRYQQRVQTMRDVWQKLLPEDFITQYAGDFGMLSLGVGWRYGRNDHWQTHLLLGFTPGHSYYHHYWSLALRETYVPWRVKIYDKWSITPLTVALSLNSILDGDFWVNQPDRYPKGYYSFSSRVRFHFGIGQRFTFHIPEQRRLLHSSISFYYEVSTCDLYVRQKIHSPGIPFREIFVVGIGVIYSI